MPTIVDALVVKLGLDASDFKRGQREVGDAWQKARGTQMKHAREVEDGNKKLLMSFNKLKVEALGFLAALIGAREIKEFVANITTTNAAVGRLAQNIGEQPQMLQAWGAAVARMGGNFEDAGASLTKVAKAFYDLKYNGKALPEEVYRVFALAGKPVPTTADTLDSFLNKTAEALSALAKHDRTAAFFFGEGMGLSDSMINLMLQYGSAMSKYVENLKGLGATEEQIKNYQKLQEEWNKLSQTVVAIGRDIEDWFNPAFLKTLEWVQSVFDAIHRATSLTDPSQLSPAKQELRKQLHLDRWDSGTTPKADGKEVTKSNPLPVQIVPGAGSNPSSSSGGGWLDWLLGRGGGGGGTPSAPAPAPSPYGHLTNPFGGSTPAPAAPDTRTWWQRHAPEALGGQSAPAPATGSAAPSGATPTPGTATAASITRRLMQDYGLTREQAIGATGVMGYESGNFQVMQEQGRSGTGSGWGWAQWTGPRRTAFMNWAQSQGLDPSSDAANYGFLQHELATNYAHVIPRMRQQTNVRDAARAWEESFEGMREGGPGIPAFERHIQRAEQYDRQLPQNIEAYPYRRAPAWWSGVPGTENRVPGPQSSLSTIHSVHPVTTSATSNAMHIGAIHVNAPEARDADGIASHIYAALGRYQMSMAGQSGQV